jgi:hypothetical protein
VLKAVGGNLGVEEVGDVRECLGIEFGHGDVLSRAVTAEAFEVDEAVIEVAHRSGIKGNAVPALGYIGREEGSGCRECLGDIVVAGVVENLTRCEWRFVQGNMGERLQCK